MTSLVPLRAMFAGGPDGLLGAFWTAAGQLRNESISPTSIPIQFKRISANVRSQSRVLGLVCAQTEHLVAKSGSPDGAENYYSARKAQKTAEERMTIDKDARNSHPYSQHNAEHAIKSS